MNRKMLGKDTIKQLHVLYLFLAGAAFLIAATVGHAVEAGEKRIAVMPYIIGKHPETVEETFTCPYSSFCYDNDSLKAGADKTLTHMLQAMLNRDFSGQVISLDESAKAFEILKIDHATDSPKTVLLRLGEILAADYMMAGNVWRYKERVGTAFSVEQPASVAFALYLVDMKTKRLIWTDSYDETQQALTENLFNVKDFFKQGAKWLTADELARFGMSKMFENFPLQQSALQSTGE